MIPLHRVSVAAASALVAALLTIVTAALHSGFTPSPGFVRTFHPTGDFNAPVSQDRTAEVSLEFIRQNPSLPRRSFGVQWRGLWHVPDECTLELRVTSDDEVQLLVGAFPTTRASMPAMLTGEAYRNQEPFAEFRGRTLERRSIATALSEHGFEARSITFHQREHPSIGAVRPPAATYTIPTPYGSHQDYVRFTALQLFDFAAFRHVPQALKGFVYNDDAWFWQRGLSAKTLDSQRSRMVRPSNTRRS